MSARCRYDLLTRGIFFKRLLNFFQSHSVALACFVTLCSCLGAGARLCICRCSIPTFNLWVNFLYFLYPPHLLSQFGTHILCHCRVALQSHCSCSDSSPPTEGMRASVGTYSLGQSVRENSALFFYKGILGCSFFACGWRPTVGGGRGHSNICAAGPCTVYLHFFLGTLRDFITNVCTCAHLRM